MTDRGDFSGSVVRLRDLLRREMRREGARFDQVALGRVSSVPIVSPGQLLSSVSVLLDGMEIEIPVTWAAPVVPTVEDRVVVVTLDGHEWFAVATVSASSLLEDRYVNVLGDLMTGQLIVQTDESYSLSLRKGAGQDTPYLAFEDELGAYKGGVFWADPDLFIDIPAGGQLWVNRETDFGGNLVTGVAAPVAGTDAANKAYVDGEVGFAVDRGAVTVGTVGVQVVHSLGVVPTAVVVTPGENPSFNYYVDSFTSGVFWLRGHDGFSDPETVYWVAVA